MIFYCCGALCKHHSQNHETQNANTQTASAQDISADIAIILAVIHGALVCIVDTTADTISNVTKFSSHIVLSFWVGAVSTAPVC